MSRLDLHAQNLYDLTEREEAGAPACYNHGRRFADERVLGISDLRKRRLTIGLAFVAPWAIGFGDIATERGV